VAQAPKMVNLAIEETSGVDHPAHLHEGWLVVKAANPSEVDEIVAALTVTNKEDAVPEDTTAVDVIADEIIEAQTDEQIDVVVPDTIEALTTELAAARAEIEALRGITESVEDDALALVKSAPEPIQKAFDALRAQAEAAMNKAAQVEETLTKERDTRADETAIIKAREAFTNLSLDPTVIGPALRKMAAIDADLAAIIEQSLVAANAQAESGAMFAEIGKAASPASGSAIDRLTSMAKAAVESGTAATVEQAVAALAVSQPDLYTDYLSQKGA